ncbi:MAG: Fic family protein [Candidatus Roizmanbacteria bacterium GW2011_GWA2_37_7]|uniref:Fic family protein n=1 Tax=Candidatus Roizmanbacteria bacterium GW2011_GWA2_37_7 TaxID=1618481 RepID=A0A0G0JNE8_9BACT|nr:MAG: Fic family protein [Candidatus Roizmanbacteria bacterium GW2011_GWA2_37_7]
MFTPSFTITNRLLANIKRINSLITELNTPHFPNIVLMELERMARAVSTHASTSIEGNPLPLTEVKKILKFRPSNIRDSELEIVNYNKALEDLNKQLNQGSFELTLELILSIQKKITDKLLSPVDSGSLRHKPVVVNDPRTGKIVFLPPDVKDVLPMMKDIIIFVNTNRKTIDPLILAGIFHKQMVIIHPFMDGNGRTTRLATKILLAAIGLNTFHLFSFENYYNKNVTKYFQTVGEYGDYYELKDKVDFTPWLEYFTDGIIDEVLRVKKLLPEAARTPQTKLQPYHDAILKHIQENGYIIDREYAKLTDRAKATRTLDFHKLLELQMIERKGKGKATYYILKNSN